MSMLNNTYVDILPFRQSSPWSELNMYSLNGTGVGGRFVAFETGQQDPADSAGQFAASTPGYDYAGVTNVRYEVGRKVKYAASGATKFEVAGLSLNGTVEYDENGQKVLFHPEVQKEKQIVPSGCAIPIATDGVFTLKSSAYVGTPIPGYVGVIAGEGKVYFTPATAGIITSGLDVCKVLSSSGSAFGGYAQVKLTVA